MVEIDYSRYTIAYVVIAVFVFAFLVVVSIQLFGGSPSGMRRYPPWISECPDYWQRRIGANNEVVCVPNEKNPNGKINCNSAMGNYNPTYGKPPGSVRQVGGEGGVTFQNASLPDRCKWARSCDVFWEGISDVACKGNSKHFNKYQLDSTQSSPLTLQ